MPKRDIDMYIYYVRATGIFSEIAISKLRPMLSVKHVITVSNPWNELCNQYSTKKIQTDRHLNAINDYTRQITKYFHINVAQNITLGI